ncbi:NAD(P)H-hydrate dehydratase [candidate division NPL-UPA2 bacterium]|nr:NAD(P)H-hydrate dehydratase [candidate division NPL-UPA2 bacterium]
MKLVTTEEMREIDHQAIEELGIPSLKLMEEAGRSVAEVAEEMLGYLPGKRVAIFVGRGNNGGDGFVAARYLLKEKAEVNIYLLGRKGEVKGDAGINLKRLTQPVEEIKEKEGLDKVRDGLTRVNLIIDALLGTGVRGEVRGILRETIELLNESGKPIISVDIPSGLEGNKGEPLGVCVKATKTVTMGLPKRGLILYPGSEYVGELKIADIGIPSEVLNAQGLKVNLLEGKDISSLLPHRRKDSHKGDYGHILILAGSTGFTGAAALAGLGALRSGGGLVTLGVAESLNPIMEMKLTEVMTKPLPETEAGSLSLEAEGEILRLVQKVDALAIGPGLSTHPETSELVRRLLVRVKKTIVIDADGLNGLAGDISLLTKSPASIIITPHPGEMGRLLGKATKDVQSERIGVTQEVASQTGTVVVLKGARTVISDREEEVYVNPTGNPGMAQGGMGDILTGMIASFIGQGLTELEAAKAGVYIHGLAGDIAAENQGETGLIASDLLDNLPQAIKRLQPGTEDR